MHAETSPWSITRAGFPQNGPLRDQLLYLLGYAVLAPSGHNTQPWKFALGEDYVDLFADPSRALPVVDPHDRELIISCGAALGFLEIAARGFGLACTDQLEPDTNQPNHLVRVSFSGGKPASSADVALVDAITARRTNRTIFTMEPLPAGFALACQAAAKALGVELCLVESDDDRRTIASLVALGDRYQFEDPDFRNELSTWVHSKTLGSKDGMSGAGFGMPDLLSPIGSLVIRTFDMGNGIAAADEGKIVFGSPALMVLASDETHPGWLNTGRALAMISLLATQHGLALSYLNQPIELAELRSKLKSAVGASHNPQILIRLGQPGSDAEAQPTARRPVEDVLLN